MIGGNMELADIREALHRIRMEYVEMPEMKLTVAQMRRLMNLPIDTCEVALATLVDSGFLVRRQDGAFVRGPALVSVVLNKMESLARTM
jgi:DNA-binding IclR family transcriptional regulator